MVTPETGQIRYQCQMGYFLLITIILIILLYFIYIFYIIFFLLKQFIKPVDKYFEF